MQRIKSISLNQKSFFTLFVIMCYWIESVNVGPVHVVTDGLHKALRWHGTHSAEVNENINQGYSQDQGYS